MRSRKKRRKIERGYAQRNKRDNGHKDDDESDEEKKVVLQKKMAARYLDIA